MSAIQVFTTTDSEASAAQIAQALVEQNLAACVQVIGPITSTYRWEDAVETAREWLCLIKTEQARYAAVEVAIIAIHPYAVPEILAVPVTVGSAAYLAWLEAAVKEAPSCP